MTGIGFQILGPVEILHDGLVLGPTTAQQRCVLAMLLLDLGRVVPMGRLVSALWASRPPASARNSIRVHVTRLRKLLAADPAVQIVTVGEGWRLTCDRERVDLYRFRDLAAQARADETGAASRLLREALSLWHGPALADAAGDWLTGTVAEGLEDERLSAIEDRIDMDLRAGAPQDVVPELSVLVAEHPLRERPARLLMSALHRSGRTAEGLEVFHRTRKRLVDELGIEPSAALHDDYQKLLSASENAGPPVAVPLPRQLPADIAVFAGRATHLTHLDALLDRSARDGRMLVAAIAGIPGAGKTALAVHWAHRVQGRFPDGQLYVNLRGFEASGDALDPADALLRFVEALGVPAAAIPGGVEARSALYRSLLADRRMLIVLDNARDEAQVRPLIPGSAGCCAVVTSRSELAGLVAQWGAHPLALDVFDRDESRDLLIGRLGQTRVRSEPEAASRIIDRCAGLPLSLTMAAARAAVQADFALSSLAAELESSEVVLDAFESPDSTLDLRTVFSWSYLRLSAEAARLFRLLGLHWGPDFTAAAAASLAGAAVPAVVRWLRELCRFQLVAEHAPGRYDLHDLLAAYAAELTGALDAPSARQDATRRLLDHYLHSTEAAARTLAPHRRPILVSDSAASTVVAAPADKSQAMSWFESERAVLLAALDSAHRRKLDRYVGQLAWLLSTYLRRAGLGAEWLATQRLALSAAHRSDDERAKALAYHGLAAAQVRFGDPAEAESDLHQALRHFEAVGDLDGQANVHSELCLISGAAEDFDAMLAHAGRSLDLYREAGVAHGQVRALNNIGYTYAGMGEYDRAMRSLLQALDLARELEDTDGEATILDSLGFACCGLGAFDQAIDHYRSAAALLHRCGERLRAGNALHRLGDAHLAVGDRGAATEVWRQALQVFEDLGRSQAATVRAKLTAVMEP